MPVCWSMRQRFVTIFIHIHRNHFGGTEVVYRRRMVLLFLGEGKKKFLKKEKK